MFSAMRSYRVQYTLPYRARMDAIEDTLHPGIFHHLDMLVGDSENDVVSQILALGAVPTKVELLKPKNKIFSKLTREYKEQFLRAIYFNCTAMSAAKALEAVIESDTSDVRPQLNPALAIIKRGGTFMEAIAGIGVFDESILAILEAGERTGTLSESINTAVEHLKSSAATAKIMIGMGLWAGVEILMAVGSLFGNRYGMLPKMEQSMPEDATPEKIAKLKLVIHYAYISNDIMIWATMLFFIVTIMGIYAYFDDDVRFRKWVDEKVQKIPALGETVQNGAIASSFKVAATLLKGGVHLNVALTIAEKASRVPSVFGFWQEAKKRLENGESVSTSLRQPLLDNSNQLLISAHTNSKQLADSFNVVAERAGVDAKKSASKFSILLCN